MSVPVDPLEQLQKRLGRFEPRQIATCQQMAPAERLALAFQAYPFALKTIRLTGRRRHPHLSENDINWRVTRRRQGKQKLGRQG